MSDTSDETEIPDELERFVKNLEREESEGHWGFTVYTTYPIPSTATSTLEASTDEAFDKSVCERFQSYIAAYLRFEAEKPYGVKIPLHIEYIRLPSASLYDARTHFRAKYGWPVKYQEGKEERTHEHHDMRHRYFVVINEETIKTLFDAPEAIAKIRRGLDYREVTEKEDEIVITVVQVDYNEACEGIIFATASRQPTKGSSDCTTFYSYIKTTPRWLKEIWLEIIDMDVQFLFKHKDHVYKGGW
ncbi:uncharacterized protein BP5553_03763 [Venustampulla echinocandica]|uniref:Uncharacterized protein n=1 Tax=Venustampulla echinocandica TaxID=2656787 RepID=A0A370TV65_9HELO|nr:uncharacterized protein BP5553_03763 [Venustampulla echinocandica]RDL39423.1 hypothetical protein BP5553_03763 [Venustampulla echinocandica]